MQHLTHKFTAVQTPMQTKSELHRVVFCPAAVHNWMRLCTLPTFLYSVILFTMQLVYLLVYLCCLHNELSYMRPHYCCVISQ